MSQDVNPNPTDLDTEKPAHPGSLMATHARPASNSGRLPSMESYADAVMDDVFEDVDHILTHSVALPPESLKASEVTLEPNAIAKLVMPILQQQFGSIVPVEPQSENLEPMSEAELDLESDPDLQAFAQLDDPDLELEDPPRTGVWSMVDRLLLVATATSVVAAIIGGFILQDRWQTAQTTASLPSAEQLQAQQHQEFLDYMGRSLDAIEQRNGQVAVNPDDESLPRVSVDGTSDENNEVQPLASVMERVYVPVYQPPPVVYSQPSQPQAPASNPMPNVAVAPTPVPAAPTVSEPTTSPEPVAIHTLTGVLELGDRSAALFEINGVTQRIYEGESIGSSGWNLVAIANQEAIIRRNGEVRSIYVGQQF